MHRRNFRRDGGVWTPHFLKCGMDTPNFGVYQVRNFAFKTSNAEMQSVIYSNVKRSINWIQFVAHIKTRTKHQTVFMHGWPQFAICVQTCLESSKTPQTPLVSSQRSTRPVVELGEARESLAHLKDLMAPMKHVLRGYKGPPLKLLWADDFL